MLLLLTLALLGACGIGGPAQDGSAAIVQGEVLAGPTCPVEPVGSPCPPRAVPDAVVQLLDGDRVVSQTRTDAAGAFRLSAPAGRYRVRAAVTQGYRSEASAAVELHEGPPTQVSLLLDTGLR